jgi:site-specific DNA recombinase
MDHLKINLRDSGRTAVEDSATEDHSSAAIYARTSSSSQRFGYSIDEQVRRCWKRCNQAGWDVRYVFADEAESGRDTERPEFQALLDKAERRLIDVVIFWKLDRFCRSLADLVRTEDQLNQWGIALQSVTEHIDTTTAVGRFNFRNLASAAELESDLTGQRTKMGMYGLAQEHKWPNDHPPIGYTKATDGTLCADEDEAKLVRRIFRLYLRERSMPQVAFLLNEEGVRSKQDAEWSRQSVKNVLSNELYRGIYEVADYREHVDSYQIISDVLFETVTEARYRFRHTKDRVGTKRKRSKADRILKAYQQSVEGTSP